MYYCTLELVHLVLATYRSFDWTVKGERWLCVAENVAVLVKFYDIKFWEVYSTYIRKSIKVNCWFDVKNNRPCHSHMKYKRCVINTTQWYPKFSTEDILYKTWKTNDTINWKIILEFRFLFPRCLFKKNWCPKRTCGYLNVFIVGIRINRSQREQRV